MQASRYNITHIFSWGFEGLALSTQCAAPPPSGITSQLRARAFLSHMCAVLRDSDTQPERRPSAVWPFTQIRERSGAARSHLRPLSATRFGDVPAFTAKSIWLRWRLSFAEWERKPQESDICYCGCVYDLEQKPETPWAIFAPLRKHISRFHANWQIMTFVFANFASRNCNG